MKVELTKEEVQLLTTALNEFVRGQQNTLAAASQVLPLAVKLQQAQEVEPSASDTDA